MNCTAIITACKAVISEKNMTNRELAKLANISESTVSRILSSGGENATVASVQAIADALGVNCDPPAAPAGFSLEDMARLYERRIQDIRRQLEAKERWLRITVLICVCLVGAILLLLLVDILSPSVGWFRRGASTGYLANTASGVYHRADCVAAAAMSSAHRLGFSSAQAAIAAGFRACQICLR